MPEQAEGHTDTCPASIQNLSPCATVWGWPERCFRIDGLSLVRTRKAVIVLKNRNKKVIKNINKKVRKEDPSTH